MTRRRVLERISPLAAQSSEHWIVVGGSIWDRLNDIPVFDDPAVAQSQDADDGC